MKQADRVAVVTGAGQGIGKAIATKFLENGLRVVIAEKNRITGRRTQKELSSLGEVQFIPTDISSEASIQRTIRSVVREWNSIDILVNNAAVFNFRPLEKITLREWNEVISTNLTGTFNFSRLAAPHLRRTKGVIINLASTRALMSEPGKEAYAASKGGIVALTHALAISLAPEVRVNCISPDWIDTGKEKVKPENNEEFPVGRVGRPMDVASLVLFLASPENSFITASNVVLDGGLTRKMTYA